MLGFITFLLIVGQLVAAFIAYQTNDAWLWHFTVGDGSLISLIRHSLGAGNAFSTHPYTVLICLYNFIKYLLLIRAQADEEHPTTFYICLGAEFAYLAAGWYYS